MQELREPVARRPLPPLLSRLGPWLLLCGILLASLMACASVGALNAPAGELLRALWHPEDASATAQAIIQIRFPRLALAALIGVTLALCGCAMQALFRNPLAEPGLVGVSSGAALGAALLLVLGAHWPNLNEIPQALRLPLAAFAGAAASAWLVIRLSLVDGQARVATLLLAGLAINAIAGAGLGLLSVIADERALRSLTFWLFGSLGRSGWTALLYALPLLLLPLLLAAPGTQRQLNALLLGEAAAAHLGVPITQLKQRLMLVVVAGVGASVALAGIIGFVGLIVPHLIRLWLGPDHRVLIPASALAGASLLLLADALSRSVAEPNEVPIGVITALIGGPFFLALLMRRRGSVDLG